MSDLDEPEYAVHEEPLDVVDYSVLPSVKSLFLQECRFPAIVDCARSFGNLPYLCMSDLPSTLDLSLLPVHPEYQP